MRKLAFAKNESVVIFPDPEPDVGTLKPQLASE